MWLGECMITLPTPAEDPYAWLEDTDGDEALTWVRQRNETATQELGGDRFETFRAETLEILDSSDRIPAVVERGDHLYNFWRDADHPRGLWRRTTWESYRSEQTEWETLIDVDALNAAEGEDWVWHGPTMLQPKDGEPWRRAMISLSHGGSDADVSREFDLVEKRFIPENEGGFVRPEAKGGESWIDADTLYVFTEFGDPDEGTSTMTSSGYPSQVRRWHRGTPLHDADVVHTIDTSWMTVGATHEWVPASEGEPAISRHWIRVAKEFYADETLLLRDGEWQRVPVPDDCRVVAHREWVLLVPRTDLTLGERSWPAGSLVIGRLDDLFDGRTDGFEELFTPDEHSSLVGMTATRHTIVTTILSDVVRQLRVHTRTDSGWSTQPLYPELPGEVGVAAIDPDHDDRVFVTSSGWLQPTELAAGDLADVCGGGEPTALETLRRAPARFDADGLVAEQFFATSADGTRVPYFQIGPAQRGAAHESPTVLYGYGGFEVSQTPSYLGAIGKAWVERGGTWVVANIRGGGEYGPRWHQAALKQNRHLAYEDFAAVADDLVARGVCTVDTLACRGGSNGGLLTGNMLARYPEKFGAIVIQVPLLDMKRYSHLLAGASWMAEYGDPDTDDWEYIKSFSPYHLVDAERSYPPVFLTSSTRDDRVHPGHARKMTALLEALGADVRYWENIEGGHGGAADNAQAATQAALIWSFLTRTIGMPQR